MLLKKEIKQLNKKISNVLQELIHHLITTLALQIWEQPLKDSK